MFPTRNERITRKLAVDMHFTRQETKDALLLVAHRGMSPEEAIATVQNYKTRPTHTPGKFDAQWRELGVKRSGHS